jgi:hypothetical protein
LEHEHVKEHPPTPHSAYTLDRLRLSVAEKSTAMLLLKALGLPEDTCTSAGLKGRCVCLCGHPNFGKPMDFGTLVGLHSLSR